MIETATSRPRARAKVRAVERAARLRPRGAAHHFLEDIFKAAEPAKASARSAAAAATGGAPKAAPARS